MPLLFRFLRKRGEYLGREREWGTYIPIPCVECLSVRLPGVINSAGQVHFCGDGGKGRVGTKSIERLIVLEVNELRIALLKRKLEAMNRASAARGSVEGSDGDRTKRPQPAGGTSGCLQLLASGM